MALPTGLVPVTVFVLTVGIAAPVTCGAHLCYRRGNRSFRAALRAALAGAGLLYLVGVLAVWAIAGGLSLWEVAATLLVAGVVAFGILTALPLAVGRLLVRRVAGVDPGTALRYATYGWPLAALAVFGVFVAPGGLTANAVFGLGERSVCLAGFCGIARGFALAILLQLVVATFGPGLVGLALCRSASAAGRTAES